MLRTGAFALSPTLRDNIHKPRMDRQRQLLVLAVCSVTFMCASIADWSRTPVAELASISLPNPLWSVAAQQDRAPLTVDDQISFRIERDPPVTDTSLPPERAQAPRRSQRSGAADTVASVVGRQSQATAQTTAPDRTYENRTVSAAPASGAHVSGYVMSPSGQPIPSARVRLTHNETGQQYEARTDAAGRYALTAVQTGTFRAHVTANKSLRELQVTGVEVAGDVLLDDFELEAAPVATFAATLYDADRIPLANTALVLDVSGRTTLRRRAVTDAYGTFSATAIPSGTVRVSSTEEPKWECPPVAFDGEMQQHFDLIAHRGQYRLIGRVEDSLGRPVPRATVQLLGEADYGYGVSRVTAKKRTDQEGRFEFAGLAPGLHTLEASYRHARQALQTSVAGASEVLLTLDPDYDAPGGVTGGN